MAKTGQSRTELPLHYTKLQKTTEGPETRGRQGLHLRNGTGEAAVEAGAPAKLFYSDFHS